MVQRTYMKVFFRRISKTANDFVIASLRYFSGNAVDILVIFSLVITVSSFVGTLILLRKSRKVKKLVFSFFCQSSYLPFGL